ncbi:sensor histidine kinase [Agromyces archimandritae]|uniref:histidine kinase n=1 Tax=Agromyces archimandritae TaxID=2781962 RepID=A0A975FPV5_9MICO|nr:histidine kinase [Agromyces archimandritae]QTX05936.1 sensor histidine kinase [Agromyces archimandritae]
MAATDSERPAASAPGPHRPAPAVAPDASTAHGAPAAPLVEPGIEWVRPRPGPEGRRRDLWLALVVAGLTTISVLLYRAAGAYDEAPAWAVVLWVAAITLPLALRRVIPEIVLGVVAVAFATGAIAGVGEALFANITLFMAFYAVGAWSTNRLRANIVRGAVTAAMFAWLLIQSAYLSNVDDYLPEIERSGDGPMSPYIAYSLINVLTNLLYFGGAWFFGDNAWRGARTRAALEQRSAELAAERERTRAQAVALERVRIARELHDVVAHHVSVMGVQAGAARFMLERDPAAAAASLEAIEASAREAVDEMQRLLGTLRGGADAGAGGDAASTRGLAQLPELVEQSNAAGLPATFEEVGAARPVPQLAGFSAYRIAQEALTNVRKHAGPAAAAEVRVRYTADAFEVEIVNTGQVRADAAGGAAESALSNGAGLGQIGMRERVAAAGGTIELGPRARGGYRVRARFPAPGAAPGGGTAGAAPSSAPAGDAESGGTAGGAAPAASTPEEAS